MNDQENGLDIPDSLREEIALERYSKYIYLAIGRALIRSMTACEILHNFSCDFTEGGKMYGELIERLENLCALDNSNVRYVKQLVLDIVKQESQVVSRNRQKLDKALGRLVPMLSAEEQRPFAVSFIQHRRATRRKAGFRIMGKCFLPEYRELLLDCFQQFGDEWALTTLTRGDTDITGITDFLLDNISGLYEQARVFEKLIVQDFDQTSKLAMSYPLAFVWGAGRTRCSECLPIVLEILQDRRKDYEDLGLVIWSLGQLGAKAELWKLANQYGVNLHIVHNSE